MMTRKPPIPSPKGYFFLCEHLPADYPHDKMSLIGAVLTDRIRTQEGGVHRVQFYPPWRVGRRKIKALNLYPVKYIPLVHVLKKMTMKELEAQVLG